MTDRLRQMLSIVLVATAPTFLFACESDDFMSDIFDDMDIPDDSTETETVTETTVTEVEVVEISPGRRLITELSAGDLSLHARTVYAALDSSEPDAARLWESRESDAEGLIEIIDNWPISDGEDSVCRYFYDTVNFRGQTEKVADAACWHDGTWWWLRTDPGFAVLEGIPVALDFYVIQTGGTLADVANVTGVPEDELMRLNPDLSGTLPKGTEVRLP